MDCRPPHRIRAQSASHSATRLAGVLAGCCAALLQPAVAAAAAAAAPSTGATPSTAASELKLAGEFLVGTFDNYEQTYWENVHGVPSERRHRRSTAIYRKADLPAFGRDVYYAHKYWDGDPAKPAYRNLYVLFIDEGLQAVRLDLLTIRNPERLDRALEDPAILSTLTPQEMIRMDPACNTVWRLQGLQFAIAMAGKCLLTSVSPTKQPVDVRVDTTVGRDHFLYLSYGYDAKGKLVYGPPDLVPSRELRAREFSCTVSRPGAADANVRLHDQGDLATVPAAAGGAPALAIRLRQFTPPDQVRSQGLALILLQPGETERVDASYRLTGRYAMTNPMARSIALADAAASVSCRVAGGR